MNLKDNFSGALKNAEQQMAEFNKSWQATGRSISSSGRDIARTGMSLTAGITAPVVAMGTLGVQQAISFESAMAGVAKTTDLTGAELEAMSGEVKGMAKEIPLTREELAGIAEAAGQLGIEKENLISFTRTIADLGATTNLTADQAATEFARFANITGMVQTDFDRLGSTVVELGNNLATTEAEIVSMGMRIGAAGTQVGMSESQIMSLAGAMSSLGLQAEAGGTAASKIFIDMQLAAELGGESLQKFAKVAGVSSSDFKQAFEKDAAGAFQSFIKGLASAEEKGTSAIAMLDEMGIKEVRTRDTLLRLAGNADLLSESLEMGKNAWDENSALAEEARVRYETVEAQLTTMRNALTEVAMVMGELLLPYFVAGAEKLRSLSEWFTNLDPRVQDAIIKAMLFAAAIGPILLVTGKLTASIGGMMISFGKFSAAVTKAGGVLKFFTAPAMLVPAIIFAIIAAGILLAANWDAIKAKAEEIWPGIGDFFNLIGEIAMGIFTKLFELASMIAGFFFNEVSSVFNDLQPIIRVFGEGVGAVIFVVLNILRGLIEFILGVFTGDWDRAWKGIESIFSNIWNGMKAKGGEVLNWLTDKVNGLIRAVGDSRIARFLTGGGSANWGDARIVGQHAQGTNYYQGGLTWVHERGAEIIELERGAKIYPHDKSLSMAYEEGLRSAPQYFVPPSRTVEKEEGLPAIVVQITGENHFHSEADEDRMAKKVGSRIYKELLEARRIVKGRVETCNAV